MIDAIMPERFTVLFGGGGTGGHLMPGLSVAEALRSQCPDCRPVFAGTDRPLERELVEGRGFEFHALPSLRLPKSAFEAPVWPKRVAGGLLGATKLIKRVKPDVAVSLGCYAAVAPSLAARLAGVPLVVMEQNAYPGKVSRLLSWWACEIYAPWPGLEAYFAWPERVVVTGNPVHPRFAHRRDRGAAAVFGLAPRAQTLLVHGGSQGAHAINEAMISALPRLKREIPDLQVIHGTGRADHQAVQEAYARNGIRAAVIPFIEDMASAYAAADLAVCRAGGTTLAELTVQGVPALLVPLPIAANDHQRRNATRMASAGAAVILDQEGLSAGSLCEALGNLFDNAPLIERMRDSAARLGIPDATENVVRQLCALILTNVPHAATERAASLSEGG